MSTKLTTEFVFGLWFLINALILGILTWGAYNMRSKQLLGWFGVAFIFFLLAGLKLIGWPYK